MSNHRQEAITTGILFQLLLATWIKAQQLGDKIYYIVGGSGVGKTQIPHQVAKELGYDAVEMYPAQKENVDFSGFPNKGEMTIGKGKKAETLSVMDLLPSRDLAILKYATKYTVVILDELDKCEMAVHNAISQLIESRKINGEPISPYIIFVATGNRLEDNAGGRPLPNQLKRRMCIIEVKPCAVSWAKWAVKNGVPIEVVGYFSQVAPQHLFSNEVKPRELVNESNPRSVVKLGQSLDGGLLFDNFREDDERETPYALAVASGEVGKPVAQTFLKWMSIRKGAIKASDVFLNPDKTALPDKIDHAFILIGALVHTLKTRPAGVVNAVRYVTRMSKEMQCMFANYAIAEAGEVTEYAEFNEFTIELDAFKA
jgi:hypothetical protein